MSGFISVFEPAGDAAEARRRARDELRRSQRLEIARRAGLRELERDDLRARPFRLLEHRPTGERFRVFHGVADALYIGAVAAFYRDGDDAVFLERV